MVVAKIYMRFRARVAMCSLLSTLLVLTGFVPASATAPLGNSTFLAQTQTQNLSGINGSASNAVYVAQSVSLNGITYYIGNGPNTGPELYSTDGTSANTGLLKDIYPGSTGSTNYLYAANGLIYMASQDNTGKGYEPWVYNPSTGVTAMLKDIAPNSSSSITNTSLGTTYTPKFTAGANGKTFFLANDASTSTTPAGTIDNGQELWVTDGVAGGTGTYKVKDIQTYAYYYSPNNVWYTYSSNIQNLTSCNGLMFFSANDSYGDNELWMSDGTIAGTQMVKDINSTTYASPYRIYSSQLSSDIAAGAQIPNGSNPANLTCVGNTLFFTADDGSGYGSQLWKTDGQLANTAKVFANGAANAPSNLYSFIAFGNRLIFTAAATNYGGVSYGYEPWISDGTAAGTLLLKDINPNSASSSPTNYVFYNNQVFFVATDARGAELWKTDGTTVGTLFVKDINTVGSGTSSTPNNFYVWNNKLFFTADDGLSGRELYVTTGSGVSTVQVKDVFPGISDILDVSNNSVNIPYFSGTTNALVFTANSPISGQELWKTDGTDAGTSIIQDLNRLPGSANAHDGIAFNGKIYFSAASAYYGQELWSTDLTTGNTQMVIDIFPGASSGMDSSSSYFTMYNGRLYFTARNATTGWELWSTDGTAAGTSVAADMFPGYGNFNGASYWPANLTVCNGKLFYSQYTGYYTLLAFDGTTSAIMLNNHLFATNLACLNNTLFFSGTNYAGSTYDAELWTTTGTLASTALFADLYPGIAYSTTGNSSSPSNLTVYKNKLYFTATNATYGNELWVTDGTALPTVIDIYAGASGSGPTWLRNYRDELWFKANNGTNGSDMMSYDGTTLTPRDLVAGAGGPAMDTNLVISGNLLWYRGNSGSVGYELFSSDGTAANSGVFEDLSPSSASTTISFLTAIGGVLMYNTYDSVMGSQPRFVVVSAVSTLTFNGNGSTGGSAPADIAVMSISATIPGNTGALVKTNYNFTGWNTNAIGTGTTYLPGATITPIVDTPLYAMWASVASYTITYNANGATSGVVAPPLSGVSSMINLDTNSGDMAKTGYAFGGWNTLANGGGTNYASGARYTPTADVTLYAKWNALAAYTISFSVNGGTGSAPTTINTFATAVVTLPGQGSMVAPATKTFAGWNTNAAGTGAGYAAAETLSPQSSMTLYAQWAATPSSTLTYDSNGATSGAAPSSLVANGTYVVIDSNTGNLAKTGYTFAGWNTQADGLGTTYQGTDNYLLNASVTLYAKWVVANYTITFSGNGNSSGFAPAAATGVSISTVLPGNTGSMAKPGYTFAGWNTLASGLGTNYSAGATYSPTSSVTLYAKWTALPTYTITYNANGANSGGAPVAQIGIYSSVTLDNNSGNLAKTTYYFAGWNTQADGLGTTYSAGSSYTPTSSITLYALWSAVPTYSVTYFGNSNTSGTAPLPQTGISGSATVSANTGSLARLGYRFDGWNTVAGGTGTAYAVASTISPTADVSLYAQWVAVPTYTITFNGNSQTSGSIPSAITSSDANVTLPGNTGVLNKTNYTFNGWNTNAAGTGTHYAVGDSYPLTASVTLYAEWLGNVYTLTYRDNYSTSGTVPAATTGRGTLTTALNTGNLAKAGYTFSGWNTQADGLGTTITAGGTYTPSADTNLYAKWTALPTYTITYNGNGHTGGSAPTASTSYAAQTVASAGSLVKNNSGFIGWNTLANGTGTAYAAGSMYSAAANVTLYAQWGALYDLSYDGNTNDGGSAPVTVTGVTTSTVASEGSLTKSNYSFAGWNTQANGGGTAYTAGATINLSGSVTLYAQWTLNAFGVTYDPNGATSGSAPMSTNSSNNAITLGTNSGGLSIPGYDFVGWNTRADGTGTSYAPGTVVNLGANTIFYAQFRLTPPRPKFTFSALSKRKLDVTGGTIEVTGTLLSLVEYVSLDGQHLKILSTDDNKLVIIIAAHAAGKVDLIFFGNRQQLTYQDAIEFIPSSTAIISKATMKNGKVTGNSLNMILLEARRNKRFTDVQLAYAEDISGKTQTASISIKNTIQLLNLARKLVNLVDQSVSVKVQLTGNTSAIVLTFSVK